MTQNSLHSIKLDSSVVELPAIGTKRAALLANLGVRTCRDLLMYLPRDYADRRKLIEIAQAQHGAKVTIQGVVVASRQIRLRGRLSLAEVTFEDATGSIKATWFGRGYLSKVFNKGVSAILTGEVGTYKGLALKNPDYEIIEAGEDSLIHTGRIVPIYRLTEKLSQRQLRSWIHGALAELEYVELEALPEALRSEKKFGPAIDDLRQVHFPDTAESAEAARRRFAYEELFELQRRILRTRRHRVEKESGVAHAAAGEVSRRFKKSLPYRLTTAQQRVIREILGDMVEPRPMARLLQGDVGSGKTVVAMHAVAAAVDSGFQAAIMAPTELLAEQHAANAERLLGPIGVRVALLTGNPGPGKRTTLKAVRSGSAQLVVGTHALFQERTVFNRLGLVVVDEQHRFGVMQRDRLAKKGRYPDLLHMTATPIPRTLALTVYGAMDVSVIDELPQGRVPIETRRVSIEDLDVVYKRIRDEAKRGRQTFVICPLIEESDKKALKAITTHYEALVSGPLAGLRSNLVHGRLASEEKDAAMRGFAQGEADVLFATSVVEVGIDVPNATTIVIEDAANFGLTQLHQLRGRVGRGQHASVCYLIGEPKTEDGLARLETMCRTNDGFEIAEADLELRGPGQIRGVQQHGESDLRVADLVRDAGLIETARHDAQRFPLG